ncbi:hypothetical protein M427DRAFT_61507 [Gonapodya prolifera JEL478]|uniref:SH3 domain-containing protein n=1 Tax=Gonapodya prolifera (strain JEL478) TaxID=1344416 RepID=A0A139A1W4_GONPJ|nr:hypothetical protein M427DRAFT_61507 [Gonapodya prolifera JEL478]|eukprot:KXS10776.1 hypothetical protein M427DRAFT_61507 [Gonapodya prolifera JEL478]
MCAGTLDCINGICACLPGTNLCPNSATDCCTPVTATSSSSTVGSLSSSSGGGQTTVTSSPSTTSDLAPSASDTLKIKASTLTFSTSSPSAKVAPPASDDSNTRIVIIAVSAAGGLVLGGILLVGGAWCFGRPQRKYIMYPQMETRGSERSNRNSSGVPYAPYSPASNSGYSSDTYSPRATPHSPLIPPSPPSLPSSPSTAPGETVPLPLPQMNTSAAVPLLPVISPISPIMPQIGPVSPSVEHIYWLFVKLAQPLNKTGETSVPYSGPNPLVVVRPYTPTMQDEVQLVLGNTVAVREVYRDGWALGTNLNTMAHGCFPMDSLRLSDLFLSESGQKGIQVHSSNSDVASVRRESRLHRMEPDESSTIDELSPLAEEPGDVRGPPQSFFSPEENARADSPRTDGAQAHHVGELRTVRGPRPWTGVKP